MAPNPAEQGEADDNNTQQSVKEGMINTKQEHDCEVNTPASVFSLFSSPPTSHQYLFVGSASDQQSNVFGIQTQHYQMNKCHHEAMMSSTSSKIW